MKNFSARDAVKLKNKTDSFKFALSEIFKEIKKSANLGNDRALIPFHIYGDNDLKIKTELESLGYKVEDWLVFNVGMFLKVSWDI